MDEGQCHSPAKQARETMRIIPQGTFLTRGLPGINSDYPLLWGLGCSWGESLASPLPTAISATRSGSLTTADMAKLLNRKPFRL